MVKVSNGLSPHITAYSKNPTKTEKKRARYIATKNKEAFSWEGDKLWYKVGQKIKSVFGKSDYQSTRRQVKSDIRDAFKNQHIAKSNLNKLIDFEIDLYVKLNQFALKHPDATKQEAREFINQLANLHNVSPDQVEVLLKTKKN